MSLIPEASRVFWEISEKIKTTSKSQTKSITKTYHNYWSTVADTTSNLDFSSGFDIKFAKTFREKLLCGAY